MRTDTTHFFATVRRLLGVKIDNTRTWLNPTCLALFTTHPLATQRHSPIKKTCRGSSHPEHDGFDCAWLCTLALYTSTVRQGQVPLRASSEGVAVSKHRALLDSPGFEELKKPGSKGLEWLEDSIRLCQWLTKTRVRVLWVPQGILFVTGASIQTFRSSGRLQSRLASSPPPRVSSRHK